MMEVQKERWTKHYLSRPIGYPSEAVVRIFKGRFPQLALDSSRYASMKVCDVGSGDGRNLVLLHDCGFEVYGTEVSQPIVDHLSKGLRERGIKARIKVGTNKQIPFEDGTFDVLLSWHVSCYADEIGDFSKHMAEFSRVLKPGGILVTAVPKSSNYIYNDVTPLESGYCRVNRTPYQVQDGQILRRFEDRADLTREYEPYFKEFVYGSLENDLFGLSWNDHLLVCTRK